MTLHINNLARYGFDYFSDKASFIWNEIKTFELFATKIKPILESTKLYFLKSLPVSIGNLTNLTRINLSNCTSQIISSLSIEKLNGCRIVGEIEYVKTLTRDPMNFSTKQPKNPNCRFLGGFSHFDQSILVDKVHLTRGLAKIKKRYGGFCELICNQILIENLLGNKDSELLNRVITIKSLEGLVNCHLINVFSFFEKIKAIVYNIYPYNIFSREDQLKLVERCSLTNTYKVNEKILFKGLNELNIETTLKLEIIKKTWFSFGGHSLLIKKNSQQEYTFFDPNDGEILGLSKEQLSEKINTQLSMWKANLVLLMDGSNFLRHCKSKKII